MKYDMAIIVTVDAGSYDGAERQVKAIAGGLGDDGINCSAATNGDFEHDNEGQRVLYLHPEGGAAE